jgi:eukaryotic-like serine/threonine-protein kinase
MSPDQKSFTVIGSDVSASIPPISAVPSDPWGAGLVVGDRYRLSSRLGVGAMGQVWRAEHVTLGTPVAVKLIDLAAQRDPREAMYRFLQEAWAAAKIQSPHIVQILDHGIEGRIAYMAMEMLEGESLATRLGRQRSLTPSETVKVVREVALAIEKAHRLGIVHRDLKPANIFFAQVEGREVVKVLDFGIAKTIDPNRQEIFVETHAGVVVGTPAYMSPEQVLGKPLDARSDLWQLGVVAFECLCGKLPFHGSTMGELFMHICSGQPPVPSSVAPLPTGFDAWFARAVQQESSARFATAADLAAALEPSLSSAWNISTVGGLAGVPALKLRSAVWRRPAWVVAAAGVAVVASVVALQMNPSRRPATASETHPTAAAAPSQPSAENRPGVQPKHGVADQAPPEPGAQPGQPGAPAQASAAASASATPAPRAAAHEPGARASDHRSPPPPPAASSAGRPSTMDRVESELAL